MPNPGSDADQLRFAQIKGRMLAGLAEHLPPYMIEASGAKSRAELASKLASSDSILNIIEVCAYVAQTIEEERARVRQT